MLITANTLKRNIYFYQINWVEEGRENPVMNDSSFLESILNEKSNELLKYTDDADVFIKKYDSMKVPDDVALWRVSKIRRTGFPQKFDINALKASDSNLKKYEGLFEPSHFAIFDGKFILSEFNSYGARVQSTIRNLINEYLKENRAKLKENDKKNPGIKKLEKIKKVQIKPILEEDVEKKIDNFSEIRGISIEVATDYAKRLTPEKHSIGSIFAAAQYAEDMYLDIGFTLGRKRPKNSLKLFAKPLKYVKELINREDFNVDNFNKIEIRGKIEEGKAPETLNLIEMFMKHERTVLKLDDKTRAVNPKNMYHEILDLYNLYKEDLTTKYTLDGVLNG